MMKLLTYCFVALLAVLAPTSARAVCNQTFSSMDDQDVWAAHGCDSSLFLSHFRAYNMHEGDWRDRGWFDACNLNLEFTKHWNAGYLIANGLSDDHTQSFHATADYRATAEADDNEYHGRTFHTATDSPGINGFFRVHIFFPSQVETACPRFDSGPAERASVWMHEGWHAWEWKHGYRPWHWPPAGNCTLSEACDYFYFHGIGAYEFGTMWQHDGTPNRFHSPNQVQVEFECDLADLAQAWVPASVRESARIDANARASMRFINGPGYYCGDSRPW